MAKEPVAADDVVRVEGAEPLFLIRGDAFEVSSVDTEGDKFFVDVYIGTVVVNGTQHKEASFQKTQGFAKQSLAYVFRITLIRAWKGNRYMLACGLEA